MQISVTCVEHSRLLTRLRSGYLSMFSDAKTVIASLLSTTQALQGTVESLRRQSRDEQRRKHVRGVAMCARVTSVSIVRPVRVCGRVQRVRTCRCVRRLFLFCVFLLSPALCAATSAT
jgi:hypothetical protein